MEAHSCPVCMEDVTTTPLACGHSLCAHCLFELRRPVCPICREPLFRHIDFYDSEDDEFLVELLEDHPSGQRTDTTDTQTLMRQLVGQLDHVEEDGNIVVLGYNPDTGAVDRVPVHPPRARRRRRRPRRRRPPTAEQLVEPALRQICLDALRQYLERL